MLCLKSCESNKGFTRVERRCTDNQASLSHSRDQLPLLMSSLWKLSGFQLLCPPAERLQGPEVGPKPARRADIHWRGCAR